jgi:hypothetical protein
MIEDFPNGKQYFIPIIRAFLKEEQRATNKPARNINNIPWWAWTLSSQLCQSFNDAICEVGEFSDEIFIGQSFEYGGATRLAEHLLKKGGIGFMADIVRLDSQRYKRAKKLIYNYILTNSDAPAKYKRAFAWLTQYLTDCMVIMKPSGDCVIVQRGEISGDITTLNFNTIITLSTYYATCEHYNIPESDRIVQCLGDNIASATPGLTFDMYREYLLKIGMDATGKDGNWDGTKVPDSRKLDFLSRAFVWHDRYATWLPYAVNHDKILSSIRCCNKKSPKAIWQHIVGICISIYGTGRLFDNVYNFCVLFRKRHPQHCREPVLPDKFVLLTLYTGRENAIHNSIDYAAWLALRSFWSRRRLTC